MTTTIQISDDLWERLNKLKTRGETFEEVITKLINHNNKKLNDNQDG